MALAQGLQLQTKILNMDPTSEEPSSVRVKSVHITEFTDARVNPEPVVIEESDILIEKHLSDRKLRLLTGVDNLEDVRTLQLKVDTSETSLGNFGALLPNLTQLRLSNSIIPSLRDLGSSLRNLTVLWMSRCGTDDIDGASSMINLRELYLSYNEICDISALSMLDQLQILDLEGNNLDDVSQIQYLELCQSLTSLIVDGNPLCTQANPYEIDDEYDYRLIVKRHLPNLKFLDEEELTDHLSPTKKSNVFDADWAYLEELQKDTGLDDSCDMDEGSSRPSSAAGAMPQTVNYRPGTTMRPTTGYRPLTASRRPATVTGIKPGTPKRPNTSMPGARPGTADRPDSSEKDQTIDSASQLTTGTVICGNISKALRMRKHHNPSAIKETTDKNMFKESKHRPEHTYDSILEEDDKSRQELLDELKAWRKDHEAWMVDLKESKAPQVLVIDHNENDSLSAASSDDDLSDHDSPDFGASDEDEESTEKPQKTSFNQRRLKLDESFDAEREDESSPTHSVRPKGSPFHQTAPLAAIPRPSPPGIPILKPIGGKDNTRSHVPASTTATGLDPVARGAQRQMPIPPAHRPVTARAVLMGSRIRRQLPEVPSALPSNPKPSLPK